MEKRKVFVIMPFDEEFFEVYEMIKMEFSENFEFSHAGEEGNQQNILKDIIQPLFEADVIIADLTKLNSNVLYELGMAHTFNKKTIVITQDELSKLPFDLKQYRAKDYSTHFKKFAELITYLRSNLQGAIDGSVNFSNPVKDFLSLEKVKTVDWFNESSVSVLSDDSEKGFIDFMAEIEEDVNEITSGFETISDEMNKMSGGMNKGTIDIQRAEKSGGASATYRRKVAKKVAGYVDTFSRKLREHNICFNTLWDRIEKNVLGLIESTFSSVDENREALILFLKGLKVTQNAAKNSQTPIQGLKKSMLGSIGLERSLNQAIRFVDDDLQNYLDFTDRICTSIDKILKKSKFVVGDIDFSNIEERIATEIACESEGDNNG